MIDLTAYHTAKINTKVRQSAVLAFTSKYTPVSYFKALFELPPKEVDVKVYVLWKRGRKWVEPRGATVNVNSRYPRKLWKLLTKKVARCQLYGSGLDSSKVTVCKAQWRKMGSGNWLKCWMSGANSQAENTFPLLHCLVFTESAAESWKFKRFEILCNYHQPMVQPYIWAINESHNSLHCWGVAQNYLPVTGGCTCILGP